VPSLKTRTALTTAYAAGFLASETVWLKVGDMDSDRGVILVRYGKEDLTVMLSALLLRILRVDWRLARPKDWLLPAGTEPRRSTCRFCIQPAARRVSPRASTSG
jgi:integrase